MFCAKCGKEIPEAAGFCRYCGNPVTREESLLDRAKRQDQAALAEIYEQTSGAVYRVLKVLIKNDEDTVQDLLQDTYVKAFTRLDQLQDESKLLPWLKTIANNSAKDWLKKCKPVLFTAMAGNEGNEETEALSFEENIEADRIDENPELAMDEKEVRRLVMEILNQLPEDQRVVLGMFYYEDMSVKEIASILEVSDNTVKSRLNYGRKKVKELVLDLEKKGTKLYNVAPFTFFVYLLYRLGKSTSVEAAELDTLQTALHTALQRTAATTSTGAGSGASEAASTVHHASQAASASSKAAGAAAGSAARHAGLKVAAVILAGVVGGGGVTYGVVKNADKIPVIQNFVEENDAPVVKVAEKPKEKEKTESTEEPETEVTEPAEEKPVDHTPVKTESNEKENIIPADVIQEGTYGDNVHWYLGADGTLAVTGEGEIADVADMSSDSTPWYAYQAQIRKIAIGDEITRIGKGTFAGMGYVKEITMADSVKEIGQSAFSGVMPRTADPGVQRTITLSQSLEKIDEYAFTESNLAEVNIPDSVREIGYAAFRRCYDLKSVTIGENSKLESIGNLAFEDCTLDSGTINIPSTVKTIKSVAFGNGHFADQVVFSEQLQELGLCAFGYGSTGMNKVFFTGDAPVISDDTIAKNPGDTVFPDTTTMIYYPKDNPTWNNYDFTKLMKVVQATGVDKKDMQHFIDGEVE
ncbi:MAG: sigma-70 family RNA polymerase sigma factor [Blautia wexlerae]